MVEIKVTVIGLVGYVSAFQTEMHFSVFPGGYVEIKKDGDVVKIVVDGRGAVTLEHGGLVMALRTGSALWFSADWAREEIVIHGGDQPVLEIPEDDEDEEEG